MSVGDFLQTAIHAALTTGAVLKEKRKALHTLRYKGETDLVTEMDLWAEKTIVSAIRQRFPSHSILTEEKGSIEGQSDEYLWLIDPLDGTTNYAHHVPWYAVSLALMERNSSIVGVVYHPELNELFYAQQGLGSFLNNNIITVSEENVLSRSLLATGFPYDIREKKNNNIDCFSNMIHHCQGIRRAGAAALDLCYVACGRFDGFWELGLSPWDTAAGALIITEAGGRITTRDGNMFSPFEKSAVASNGYIHEAMINILQSN